MISNEECREVAERLRQMADAHHAVEASRVARAIGLEYEVYGTVIAFNSAAVQDLADRIDRPTCHDSADFDRESFRCSNCGYRIASLTPGRADASVLVSPEGLIADWGYCPHCGTEVVPNE